MSNMIWIAGSWPTAYDEVMLVINEHNEIVDYTMYSLGFKDPDEVKDYFKNVMAGEGFESTDVELTYEEALQKTFKLLLPTDFYQYNEKTKTWDDMREDKAYMKELC